MPTDKDAFGRILVLVVPTTLARRIAAEAKARAVKPSEYALALLQEHTP